VIVGWSLSLALGGAADAQIDLRKVYVSASGALSDLIYEIDPRSGNVVVFADSSDGLEGPSAMVFDKQGNLLVSNYDNNTVSLFRGPHDGTVILDSSDGLDGPFGQNGLAFDQLGNLYVSSFDDHLIWRFSPGGARGEVFADSSDGIDRPNGLVFDLEGNLLVANRGANNILLIRPDGETSVLAETGCNPYSIDIRSNGDVYYVCSDAKLFRWKGGDPAAEILLGDYSVEEHNYAIRFSSNEVVLFMVLEGSGELLAVDPKNGEAIVAVESPELDKGHAIAVYRAVPELAVGGRCPGAVTVSLTGAAPNGGVAIVQGLDLGESLVPGGPCAGSRLQLSDARLELDVMADEAGEAEWILRLDETDCGSFLEAVDRTTCAAGAPVAVPE